MKYSVYVISAKTNMHIGSGDTTFGVIDNKVQRDVLTNYPTIHSSSIKGALREFFKESIKNNTENIIDYIFGNEGQNQGFYRFFDANLLSYPVRSDKRIFYRATTVSIIKKFLERIEEFNLEIKNFNALNKLLNISESGTLGDDGKVEIEDFNLNHLPGLNFVEGELPKIETILGKNIVILTDEQFREIMEELPVIARNHLENGESKNLWYEEIVPRETKFYFFVGIGEKYEEEFNKIIQNDLVQIGGNASIGYGFSKITKIL